MARDPDLEPVPIAPGPQGKPDDPPPGDDPYSGPQYTPEVVKSTWLARLADAERAEERWRGLGREIVEIYRNESAKSANGKRPNGGATFNILYSNTEVMLPAVYQKPPQPVVRSRFTSVPTPMVPPPMPPPGVMAAGGMSPPGMSPVGPPEGGPAMPGPGGPPTPPPMNGGPPPPMNGGPPPMGMPPPGPPPMVGPMAPGGVGNPIQLPPELGQAPPPFGMAPGQPSPPMPTLPSAAPGRPEQADIETAASVMEKALEIVLDDENGDEAVKTAIKDVLLPGRGVCRVRWKPQMGQRPVMAGDGMTPLPAPAEALGAQAPAGMGDNGGPPMEEIKVWETVNDEYVYWEDLLVDPVRQAADTEWIAFRHLFTKEACEAEFAGSPEYEKLKEAGKLDELFRWTEESAAKQPVGGGAAMKTADKLGAQIFKAMIWEIWDRAERRVIWFIRDYMGVIMRIDADTLQLAGFYPCPVPMLAVTTSDSRIPRPFYELYRKLADDLEDTSARISRLTKQLKHVALYNGASKEIGQLLTAEDGKMIAVPGVDMIAAGGLANHIWVKPILEIMQTLKELYLAREQIKMAIYEVMGISDIMRGSTNANETATAQRIKGSMGVNRMNDTKKIADNFVRDLLRLKAEIIAQNFDAETLAKMTGEEVTPAVLAILRSDFQRTCGIDIETDSTVVPDLMAEQEAMAQTMAAITGVMAAIGPLMQSGILPPAQVVQLALELLKLAIHPIRYSRGVMELINGFQDQLEAQIAMQAMLPPAPPPMPPPGQPGAGQRAGPPGTPSPPPPGGPVPKSNGAAPSMPPPPMLGA